MMPADGEGRQVDEPEEETRPDERETARGGDLWEILSNGLLGEIARADESKSIWLRIALSSEEVISRGYGGFFGMVQQACGDRMRLSAAKLFDKASGDYRVRSIPGALKVIEEHAGAWTLPGRGRLARLLIDEGWPAASVQAYDNPRLVRDVLAHYRGAFPDKSKAETCELSEALKTLRFHRDKGIAHSEAVPLGDRPDLAFEQLDALLAYAHGFAATVAEGVLGVIISARHGMYSSELSAGTNAALRKLLDDIRKLPPVAEPSGEG